MSKRRHTALITCLAATLSFAMAGCTSDKKEPGKDQPAAPNTQVSTTPLPKEGTFKGKWDGAAKDLTVESCGLEQGDQVAKGVVKNSTSQARDYQVIIMWMKKDDGKPYGAGLVSLKGVKPGESRPVEIKAKVATTVDKCVPNVKAGALE